MKFECLLIKKQLAEKKKLENELNDKIRQIDAHIDEYRNKAFMKKNEDPHQVYRDKVNGRNNHMNSMCNPA